MQKDRLTYCDKCGKGVIMSFTCDKCGRVICDTCGGMTATPPEQHSWGTMQTLGGGSPQCPFCDAGEPPESQHRSTDALRASVVAILNSAADKEKEPWLNAARIESAAGFFIWGALPLGGWLICWLLLGFRWWSAILLGGCCGIVVGFILLFFVSLPVSCAVEGNWNRRFAAAASGLFNDKYNALHPERTAAIAALCEVGLAEPRTHFALLLDSLQEWKVAPSSDAAKYQRGLPGESALAHGTVDRLHAIAAEMEPYLNKSFAYKPFRLGLASDAPHFHPESVPLLDGEEVICTIDQYPARSASALRCASAAAVITGRRVILCRNWSDDRLHFIEIPYEQVETIRRSRGNEIPGSNLVAFYLVDGTIRSWGVSSHAYLAGFLSEIVKASGAPRFSPWRGSLDLAAIKASIIQDHGAPPTAEQTGGRVPRLVCHLCGEVYLVGKDACIVSLGNVFAFMAGQGTGIIGDAAGMAASTPDLVARIMPTWSKDERELKLRDTQTNVERVRSLLKAGQQLRWECCACKEKGLPNPYPKDF